jgi:protein TonB
MSRANIPASYNQQTADSVIIFRDLPATFPERDKYEKPSILGSLLFHGILIAAVLLVPLLLHDSIPDRDLLIDLVSPIGPPPPPPPAPLELPAVAMPAVVKPQIRPAPSDVLVVPMTIPRDIAQIVDKPIESAVGVIGGVPGGMPGGTINGVLGGVLSSNTNAVTLPPPPPPVTTPVSRAAPPVEPIKPVRVGGDVKEPRPVRVVAPVYPLLASKARVGGIVVLEATLTAQGTVEEIRVISGHPLLVDAAIACVKQWQYEPTLLNGVPVPVILTAKVSFLRPIS